MTPEGKLKEDVFKFLARTEYFWMRMNSGVVRKGSRFIHLHREGTADAAIYRPGMVFWVELKALEQKTAPDREQKQAEFAEKVRSLGHKYAIVRSVQELQAFLSL